MPNDAERDARNPDRIWLQPSCFDGCDEGRCWAEHDLGPCDECGEPCVEYVRAESAPLQERIRELEAEIAQLTDPQLLSDDRTGLGNTVPTVGEWDRLLRRALAAEARLAAARAEGQGWRPIETLSVTALPDEKQILVCHPKGVVSCSVLFASQIAATHWQPLPAAPATGGEDE